MQDKDNLIRIKEWIHCPEGHLELEDAYKVTKKIVDELIESRKFTQEELWRQFTI